MKTIFLSSIFLILALMGNAQDKKIDMGGGGFTIGYGNMDVSQLQMFVPADVKQFNNDQLLLGGEGHGFRNGFVIGGSGYGFIGDQTSTDSVEVSLGGGLGTFDLGYLVLNRDKVKLYPMLGIGGGGYSVRMSRNHNIPAGEIGEDPGQEINIGKGGVVLDVSLNLNLIPVLDLDEETGSYGGMMTGLKLGYVFNPVSSSNWSYSGGAITGGPDFRINMFYVKFIIGGFGFRKQS